MGLMRLTVHDRDRIPPSGLGQVYMCGQDELPWRGHVYFSGDQLIVERAESDSGCAWVPWRINGRGVLLLGTSTLVERDDHLRPETTLEGLAGLPTVFKKDGVMTPAAFFHAGPVNGWRIR